MQREDIAQVIQVMQLPSLLGFGWLNLRECCAAHNGMVVGRQPGDQSNGLVSGGHVDIRILADSTSEHYNRVKQAVSLVNGAQRFFRLTLSGPEVELPAGRGLIEPFDVCQDIEKQIPDQYFVAIVDQLFEDNWFSHEYRQSSIITIGDWEREYAPPTLRAYITCAIARSLLNFAAEFSEEMLLKMVHEPPKGCIMDMCVHKPNIKLGMVSGGICARCWARLREFGVSEDILNAIERILLLVRSEALGRPVVTDPLAAFVVMRFSNNDENDHAYTYGIKPGLEDSGLHCIRANDRVESGQILDKILRHLTRSRFVVAKVDVDNLNVYFELGLALGFDKDVLLISERDLILHLPSDLRNWECLTYQHGDYEDLKNRVKEFFSQTYGLPYD